MSLSCADITDTWHYDSPILASGDRATPHNDNNTKRTLQCGHRHSRAMILPAATISRSGGYEIAASSSKRDSAFSAATIRSKILTLLPGLMVSDSQLGIGRECIVEVEHM
jgi:hypothetical protein